MTRIVVLDECRFDDRHIARLRALGDLTIYQDNPSGNRTIVDRLRNCDIAVVGWTEIDGRIIDVLPALRMISVWATGYNYIDVVAARQRGVTVTNVPAYAETSVAEYCIGLMLNLARPMFDAGRAVRRGRCEWKPFVGSELRGRTLGVIGTGYTGCELIRLARAFGMNVVAYSRTEKSEVATALGFDYVGFADVLRRSDYLSLHVPLTGETRFLIGTDELAQMKHDAFIINTARADIVDQAALVESLSRGEIRGAALDDVSLPADELVSQEKVIVTPHIGFYTAEALTRKGDVCVHNVESFVAGKPRNVVS